VGGWKDKYAKKKKLKKPTFMFANMNDTRISAQY